MATEAARPADTGIEAALRENQRMLATLLGNLPGMAYRCLDDEYWTMEVVSEGCRELTGYLAEDLVGNRTVSYESLILPEDRPAVRTDVGGALARGERFDLVYRIRTAGGEVKWVHERGRAVPSERPGPRVLEGFIHDITAQRAAEQARDEHAGRLRAIFDHTLEFIGLLDPAGRLLQANQTSLKAANVRWADVEGQYFWDTVWWNHSPEEQARLRAAIARAAQGEPVRYETTHPLPDGRLLDIDFALTPVRDASGRVTAIIPEGRDITDRKEVERALRESEEKFATAFRLSPQAMSIASLEDGRYLEVNQGHEAIFGWPRQEVIGRTPGELGLILDPDLTRRAILELRATGRVRQWPVEVRTRGGELRTVVNSAELIRLGGRECALLTSHDITDQRRAEQALRESEEKFAKAFRSSPGPIAITEVATGRYIDVNLGFERVTGHTRDELIGRTSIEIGIWADAADRARMLARLETEPVVRDMELVFRRKDGGRIVTLCSFERIELAGRTCMLSTITDITEQREAEGRRAVLEAQLRQNQKLEALGTLAGGIAHDFNNILTAIVVNQELALMDIDQPAELRERLREIGLASSRAKELVRQILTFSRHQGSHARLRQRLASVVQEAMGLVRASLPATIEIEQQLSADAPAVLADATQVHQIVMNLCTNAAHAMRGGKGQLTVTLDERTVAEGSPYPGLGPGRYARLAIADTGHGMDAAVLSRIFEPFFTTKGPGEGTGLGLAVVHGIMKDHGGGVYVQSAPGVGTTFELLFPEAGDPAAAVPAAPATTRAGHGESVLVVDDEPAVGAAVGAMLRKLGYRVETFVDAEAALARFAAAPRDFDLILTDHTMPRMTGPELLARLRTFRPDVPALIMSGLSAPAEPGHSIPGAAHGRVGKPLDIIDLSHSIHRALHESSPS